jgi:hypothetical protein
VPVQTCCPHCDSRNIEPMALRSYESTSAITWYQCRDCSRMWNLPKLPPHQPPLDHDESPES